MQDTNQQQSPLDMVNSSVSDLKSWTKSMLDYQNNTIQEHKNTVNQQKDDGLKNVFNSSLSATDQGTRQECNNYFRLGLVAKGIRDFFAKPENGGYDYSSVDDDVLFDSYANNNPDRKNELYNFVLSDEELCDPTPLYESMGWIEPEIPMGEEGDTEEESSNPRLEFGKNAAGGITESFMGLPKLAGYLGADMGEKSLEWFGADEERAKAASDTIKQYIDKLGFGDENSLGYKIPKGATDLLLAYLLGKGLFPQTTIGNLGIGTKSALGAAEGTLDMALYDMISDSELPSKGDLNLGFGLGAAFPYLGPLYKAGKNLLGKKATTDLEKTIGRLTKMTEARQDKFFKDFGVPFEQWMRERSLNTYDDIVNFYKKVSAEKTNGLKAIKGRYSSEELNKVLDDVVKYAEETGDKELSRFKELQIKNAEGGLEMLEIEEIKHYFEMKRKFNYDATKTSEQMDLYTNMDDALRDWQRDIAKENGFENLALFNNEKQALYVLDTYARDMTKIGRKGASLWDFVVAVMTGDVKAAATYLFSKNILSSSTFNKYYAKVLNKLINSKSTEELVVDYEKIQSIQDEKAFLEWLEEAGLKEQLPYIEGAKNEAGTTKTILKNGEPIVTTPEGESILKRDNNGRNNIDFTK